MSRPLFQLGPRLALCASLLEGGESVADIGTDHGYLPIWLIKTGKVPEAVGADVRPGPLDAARKNGERYQTGDSLHLYLSDGFEKVPPCYCREAVVAGMGGELIFHLLQQAPWLKECCKRIVVQPMSAASKLRLGLFGLGYQVEREEAVWDSGKVYSAFSLIPRLHPQQEKDVLFPYMGKLVPGKAYVKEYGEKEIRKLQNKARGFRCQGDESKSRQLLQLCAEIEQRYCGKGACSDNSRENI